MDGQTYLYTHDEPADARRFMACFEQPDLKAAITVVVTAPAGWEVLSNQSAVATRADGDAQTVEFAPTLPLSSYLICIAAGPYVRAESEWRRGEQHVPLAAFCRASMAEHFDADEILRITRQGLDFFADAFAFPYPWGKYDQIFVPEYNIGAMENPGLVTFTESYLFRGAATRGAAPGAGEHDPARDGAHVVRRPGHHDLVGRPVAEGVVRRLHGLARLRGGDRVHRGLGGVREPAQGVGVHAGPAAQHPSDRRRHPAIWRPRN